MKHFFSWVLRILGISAILFIISVSSAHATDNALLMKFSDNYGYGDHTVQLINPETNKEIGRCNFQQQSPTHGYIAWLGVNHEYRANGYGKLLLQQACRKLKELGCTTVSLWVLNGYGNTTALNLYREEGFKGDPDHMEKNLLAKPVYA